MEKKRNPKKKPRSEFFYSGILIFLFHGSGTKRRKTRALKVAIKSEYLTKDFISNSLQGRKEGRQWILHARTSSRVKEGKVSFRSF
jgi:hypothetical protein